VSVPPNFTRAELLAVLGAEPDTSLAAAYPAYLSRRAQLLAADPARPGTEAARLPEVARLDDAFARLRAAADVEHRLGRREPAETRIGVDGATVLVRPAPAGTADGEFPFPGVERVHVLTAFNPRAQRRRPHENASRQRALAGRVVTTGLAWWPAVSGEGRTEPSIAVAGLTRAQARALGLEFGQDAVVEWTRTAWSLVPCDELVAPRELGWRSSRLAEALPDPMAVAQRAEAATAARTVPVPADAPVPAESGRSTDDGQPGERDEARDAGQTDGLLTESRELLVAEAVLALAAHEAESAAIARARELTAAARPQAASAGPEGEAAAAGPTRSTDPDSRPAAGGPAAAGGTAVPRKADPAAGSGAADPHDLPASHGGNGE